MTDAVLALNVGSSSIKFALYAAGDPARPALLPHGHVEGIGTHPHLIARLRWMARSTSA